MIVASLIRITRSRIAAMRRAAAFRAELALLSGRERLELAPTFSADRAAAVLVQASDQGWSRESRQMYGF